MAEDGIQPIGHRTSCARRLLCGGTRERSGLDVSEYPAVER
jgi:hypothetical protein